MQSCGLLFPIVPVAQESAANGEEDGESRLALRKTYYYVADEADYRDEGEAAFLGMDGDVLYRGSQSFHDAAVIEGTARTRDGRILNLGTKSGPQARWIWTNADFGLGSTGCPLVPFRSAAVDSGVVPLGSRLHIAETVGMPLPDGGRHDGTWYATDEGPAITGDRIDLFVGIGEASGKTLERHGLRHLQPLTVTVTEAPPAAPRTRCLTIPSPS